MDGRKARPHLLRLTRSGLSKAQSRTAAGACGKPPRERDNGYRDSRFSQRFADLQIVTLLNRDGAHRDGARAGNRTLNLGLKRPLLCQLSYASGSVGIDC